jgi:putative transposase
MSTYTSILYQVVFSTKHRKPVLTKPNRARLFRHIMGILQDKRCHLYQVNGVEDHIHIVFALHPSISLAGLVKDIKLSTNRLIKEEGLFPGFEGWQEGYGAFTYSHEAKENLIRYVKRQEQHHSKVSSLDELIAYLKDQQIEYDPKYLN